RPRARNPAVGESPPPAPPPPPTGGAGAAGGGAPPAEDNGHAEGNRALAPVTVEPPPPLPVAQLVNEVGDDRDNIRPGDRVLLVVENDLGFARFLLDTAHELGLKGLVTSLGAAAP